MPPQSSSFCSRGGASVQPDANFCHACGAPVQRIANSSAISATAVAATERQNGSVHCGALCLIGLGYCAFVDSRAGTKSKPIPGVVTSSAESATPEIRKAIPVSHSEPSASKSGSRPHETKEQYEQRVLAEARAKDVVPNATPLSSWVYRNVKTKWAEAPKNPHIS